MLPPNIAKSQGITLQVLIQHGATTALHYREADGAFAELQVDNYATTQEAADFMHTQAYANGPLGPVLDKPMMIEALRI
jgi:hypothetical protein